MAICKFYEDGYVEENKMANLPRHFIVGDSRKTEKYIRKYLEIREFYGTLDPEKNYLDHTIYLMGFYIESDVTRKSEMIPFGFLHLEIIKLFKKPAVNFILIYAGNLNRLFIYDRPPNSMDFAIER